MQVIGSVFNNPHLLDNEDYNITENDFYEDFHRILYGAIYKLYNLGSNKITLESITDFLALRPKSESIFNKNDGAEYLVKVSSLATAETFNYYYHRLKKFTLLRAYDDIGLNLSDIYDPDNIFDLKKKQQQEEWLDNCAVEDIVNIIESKIENIKLTYLEQESFASSYQAGEGIENLIDKYKETPEFGVPLYGDLFNTVTKGARLKKFYIRSGPSGVGKTRAMVADSCYIACNKIYDETFKWIKNGISEPVLFISTELELEEVQTLMLAFLANVDEEHILNGKYADGEEERVRVAVEIIKESPLYIEILPDFSLRDIENLIKRHIRQYDIKFVFYDYLHSSLKILEEITHRTGGIKLREDNILFMISVKLKDICNQYGVFIMTATQLNGDWKTEKIPDQNLLRGAKAIADKVDFGSIILPVKPSDIESLDSILATNAFPVPNLKISIYKNRRGKHKGIYLWCKANLGTCRIDPLFCTDFALEFQSIEKIKIIVKDE